MRMFNGDRLLIASNRLRCDGKRTFPFEPNYFLIGGFFPTSICCWENCDLSTECFCCAIASRDDSKNMNCIYARCDRPSRKFIRHEKKHSFQIDTKFSISHSNLCSTIWRSKSTVEFVLRLFWFLSFETRSRFLSHSYKYTIHFVVFPPEFVRILVSLSAMAISVCEVVPKHEKQHEDNWITWIRNGKNPAIQFVSIFVFWLRLSPAAIEVEKKSQIVEYQCAHKFVH